MSHGNKPCSILYCSLWMELASFSKSNINFYQCRIGSLPKKSIHNYATNTYCMFSGQDHLSKFKKIQFNNSSLVKKGKLPLFFYIQWCTFKTFKNHKITFLNFQNHLLFLTIQYNEVYRRYNKINNKHSDHINSNS